MEPMSDQNFDETTPVKIEHDTQPVQIKPGQVAEEIAEKPRRWPWVLLGIVVMLLVIAAGGYSGYRAAVNDRTQQMNSQKNLITTEQFALGIQDMEAGRLESAQQRFEYVIKVDPQFPGAPEKLTEVMIKAANRATPTPVVTPTIAFTPTPDLRGVEELFSAAQQYMRAQDWENAILTLDLVRKENLEFRPLDVDGMYYISLRNRGVFKIVQTGNLEGGIYDLALTERFGPLDKEADAYRNWARYYLAGTSFWEVDWVKVLEYFSQLYASLPNLRDGSGYTVAERYKIASKGLGDQLAAKENWCEARDQYFNALSVSQDGVLAPTATFVQLKCAPPTATLGAPTATTEITVETPIGEVTPSPETPVAPSSTPETPVATP